jgi:hypothetical protein
MNRILSKTAFILFVCFVFLSLNTISFSQAEKKSGNDTSKVLEIKIDDQGVRIKAQKNEDHQTKKNGKIEIIANQPTPVDTQTSGAKDEDNEIKNVGEATVKMGDITVEEGEKVEGDVTSIGGNATVKGTVEGNVVAIGGNILVSSTGTIEENATSIGGEIKIEPGGTIEGEKVSIQGKIPGLGIVTNPHSPFYPKGISKGMGLFWRVIKILFLLFIGMVVLSVVPGNVSKVKDKIEKEFLKSTLFGFLGELLILPIFVLLLITIIGIPVAILIEPIVVLVAFVLGYTAVSLYIGEKLKQTTNIKHSTPLLTLFAGILAVELIPLVGRTLGLAGGPIITLTWILVISYWGIIYVILTAGFGGAILSRFGTRPKPVPVTPNPTPDNNKPQN